MADARSGLHEPRSAYASQYVAVCTGVQEQTPVETLTTQSLLLLGRCTATPQSSPHSSVHEWLQTSGTAAPPPSPAESISSSSFELQHVFASGAEQRWWCRPPDRSSRMSRTSRRSVASTLAMEIFRYSRDMSGHLMQMVGQMLAQAQAQQDQSQNQVNQILAQAEAQRAEARQTEEAQRAEAMKREELALVREQMLAKMKAETDEATRKREQLFMEHELKRQKVLVDANTTLQQEKLEADMHREIANLEAHW